MDNLEETAVDCETTNETDDEIDDETENFGTLTIDEATTAALQIPHISQYMLNGATAERYEGGVLFRGVGPHYAPNLFVFREGNSVRFGFLVSGQEIRQDCSRKEGK